MHKYYTKACNFYYGTHSKELVKKRKTLPLHGNSQTSFDQIEIPDITHGGGQSLQLWLAQTLGKDPAFLDPWGNEYVYEYPLEDGGQGYRLFSMGPDGKTGDVYTQDDIR